MSMLRTRIGLTLIELLMSVAIGLALSTLATVCFLQARGALARAHSRLEMHNSARLVYQNFADKFSALEQDGALYLETTADGGTGAGKVDLVFLKGKVDDRDFSTNVAFGAYINEETDLGWCLLRYDEKRRFLADGVSSPPRDWICNASWKGPKGDYNSHRFRNMPQPQRSAGSSAAATLASSKYGSGDVQDYGDYTDVTNHLDPFLRNVTAFTVELVGADGSVLTGDVNQTREVPLDGDFVDGTTSPTSGTSFKSRPVLIRIRFDLTDPVLDFTQTFSFSFQPPGFLPGFTPAS
jgi:hypothetical protein